MSEHRNVLFFESDAAREASEYFNSLPRDERAKLAPLLEHYRQMGLAEAANHMRGALVATTKRVNEIRRTGAPVLTPPDPPAREPQPDLMAALEASLTKARA